MANPLDRLAVCSWSLRPESPAQLIEKLTAIGINRVQLAIDPIRRDEAWEGAGAALAASEITVVSGMFEAVGEDYSTLDKIKATGGVVPDETWPDTWANFQQMVPTVVGLGVDLVTLHAGFLPEEPEDPNYDKLIDRLREVADLFADNGLRCGFETGQEDADTLILFLERLDRANVGVNFDPANMILYAKGDPIEALKKLRPFVLQCHIKDATKTQTPGEWGAEVPAGTGEVDWDAFFATLDRTGYSGDLAIEREAGEQRVEDIVTAKELATKLLAG